MGEPATYRGLDPALGRWCQIDPKAEAVKSLTPYGSMNNNPISNVDPEGDIAWFVPLAGAAVGVFGNGLSNVSSGQRFFDGWGKAAAWGAVSATVSAGIGDVFGGTGSFGKEFSRAGTHAFSGGIQSELQGESFGHGFLSGGISSGIGSGINSLGGNDGHLIIGGSISGGIGSAIGGGNFFQGMTQGIMVGAFNDALHNAFQGDPKYPPRDPKTNKPYIPGDKSLKYIGKKGGRDTWVDSKGRVHQWDYKKGEVEKYNKRGRNHKGGFDANDLTRKISKAVKGRIASGFKVLGPLGLPINTNVFNLWLESTLGYKPNNSGWN